MLLVPWHSMNFMCSTKGSEVVVSFWVGVVGTWEITVLNLLYFVEGSGAGSGTQYAAICHRAAPPATCLVLIYLISLGDLFPFWSLGSSLGRYCIYILYWGYIHAMWLRLISSIQWPCLNFPTTRIIDMLSCLWISSLAWGTITP